MIIVRRIQLTWFITFAVEEVVFCFPGFSFVSLRFRTWFMVVSGHNDLNMNISWIARDISTCIANGFVFKLKDVAKKHVP